ncbi:hypothetical protein L6R52_09525 [Myxococcota bacterium]|nr:hypothetical protein [Myxococcota bacterium]
MRSRIAIALLSSMAFVPSAVAAPPGIPQLAGRWARVQLTTAGVKVPVLGELSSKTTATLLITIRQDGADLEIEEQVCGLESVTSKGLVRTNYPPAFLTAVSGRTAVGRLKPEGDRVRYFEGRGEPVVRGATLADPKNDPLPTTPEDPRLVDGDRDGKPGLTVEVAGFVSGKIQVVQRGGQAFSGLVRSPELVEGGVRWWTEQQILGADPDVLKNGPTPVPDPDSAKNRFRMRRVPDDFTCADVMKSSDELLGTFEE